MRLIDADALREDFTNDLLCLKFGSALQGTPRSDIDISNVLERIEDSPTIEAEPVRHGEWKKIQNFAKCSECMHEVNWGSKDFLSPYCPNCGAKMEGGEVCT